MTVLADLSLLPILQAVLQIQPGAGGGQQMMTMLITFGLIIVIFYFLVIRPQSKKQKETQKMLEELKKGDRVSTAGGIRGVITAVKDQSVTIKVDDTTKIEFNKSAVSSLLERPDSSGEGSKDNSKQTNK